MLTLPGNFLQITFETVALAKKVLCTISRFQKCTPVRELHMVFQVLYIYDYTNKLCRQEAEVIRNHENANFRDIGNGEARYRRYKRLKLGGGKAYCGVAPRGRSIERPLLINGYAYLAVSLLYNGSVASNS
jgi:hypothetical protein